MTNRPIDTIDDQKTKRDRLMKHLTEFTNELFADTGIHIEFDIVDYDDADSNIKDKLVENQIELKKPEELTLGEQYILFLLKENIISEEQLNCESVITTITDSPVTDFICATTLNDVCPQVQKNMTDFIADLISSVMLVDIKKLVKVNNRI